MKLEARVKAVVEIVGCTTDQAAAAIANLDNLAEAHRIDRLRNSKKRKLFGKQLGAALRHTTNLLSKAPGDFRVPPPGFGVSQLLRHLKLLNALAEDWENAKLDKPKPSAEGKLLAARTALDLCVTHKVKLTTTTTDKLCQIAAVLYGQPNANLQHQVRRVLADHKAGRTHITNETFDYEHLERVYGHLVRDLKKPK